MIINGITEESLFDSLKILDESTGNDSILTHGQTLHIECVADSEKGLINWTAAQDIEGKQEAALVDEDISMNAFLAKLKKRVSMVNSNEDVVVLCFGYAESVLVGDKVRTHWIKVNPIVPFEFVNGKPDFPMIVLDLTNENYNLAMESRMALYNELTENVYIIREIAFSSIGKLLDSAASFKNMAKIPLGSALLLANRMAADSKELKLIYRNARGKVKPLIGLAGNRFTPESEYNFYKTACLTIDVMFGCGVKKIYSWSIEEDMTNAYVQIGGKTSDGQMNIMSLNHDYGNYFISLRIRTSDIPGISASVTAFIKIGEGEVQIQKNSAYHWDAFIRRGGAASLFYRSTRKGQTIPLKDDIDSFLDCVNVMKESEVKFSYSIKDKIHDIMAIIGMRRTAKNEKLNQQGEDELFDKYGSNQNAYSLFEEVINKTYMDLPPKQRDELSIKYMELFEAIYAGIKK